MPARSKDTLAIGVDIGGTFVKVALVGQGPVILEHSRLEMDTSQSAETVLRALASNLSGLVSRVGKDVVPPVGVGCAGLIDSELGIVRTSPNLPLWKDVPLTRVLSERLGTSVTLDNDANVFSFAEGFYGAARDCPNGVFVTLGTGVGGGLKLDGRLYTGACGYAGEIGHTTIVPDGPVCACGNRGCLESLVGSASIVRRVRSIIEEEGRQDEWLCGGLSSLDELTVKEVGRAAGAGNEIALRVFGEVGEYLGIALANIINLLNPDMAVIGGGVARAGEPLFSAVRSTVLRRALGLSGKCVEIVPARFGQDAGVVGAAMKALCALQREAQG